MYNIRKAKERRDDEETCIPATLPKLYFNVKTYILMFKKREIAKRSVSWKLRVSGRSGKGHETWFQEDSIQEILFSFWALNFHLLIPGLMLFFYHILHSIMGGCMHDFVRGGLWKNEKWIPPAQSGFRALNFHLLNPGFEVWISTCSIQVMDL